jgi:hypothetical protein
MNEGKAQPVSDYVITPHCSFELKRRMISEDVVRSVLRTPEQRLPVRTGRVVLQSKMKMTDKTYLIRVFVDVDRHPTEVVTAYLTSKISKYWRNEP